MQRLQSTSNLILRFPAADSAPLAFWRLLSCYDLWFRPSGVARFLGFHGSSTMPPSLRRGLVATARIFVNGRERTKCDCYEPPSSGTTLIHIEYSIFRARSEVCHKKVRSDLQRDVAKRFKPYLVRPSLLRMVSGYDLPHTNRCSSPLCQPVFGNIIVHTCFRVPYSRFRLILWCVFAHPTEKLFGNGNV